MTRVWIVEDQDTGDNASTVTKVFTSLHAAKQWMLEHADEAFGYFTLAAPLEWDGTDYEASFEVQE